MSNSLTQDVRFRQSICEYAKKFGITKAAIRYKKHKSYVHRWLKRYDGTLESLKKKSTRPKHHPNEHTKEEIKWIQDYKRRKPQGSLVDVWISLRKHKGYTRTIPGLFRAMRRLGYYKTKTPKKKIKSGKMEEMTFAGEKVQIDVKVVPRACITSETPLKLFQYTAIDEYTRIRYIEAFEEQSTYSSTVFLVHAIQHFYKEYGIRIKCIQTDNGREFTSRFDKYPKPTMFEQALEKVKIKHKLIRPYTPRHNGKVERSHREDQARFYSCHKFYSFDDFKKQLEQHLRYTNNRPMRPLGYLSPIQFLFNSVPNV